MLQKQPMVLPPKNAFSMNGDRGIPRRTLLKKAFGLGLAAASLLAGCSPFASTSPCDSSMAAPAFNRGKNSPPLQLTWMSEYSDTDVYDELTSNFNANHSDISIRRIYPSQNTDVQHDVLVSQLQHGQGPEIVSLDITWIEEFVQRKWLVSLCDFWPAQDRKNYLSIPLQSATIDGKVYAAPFRGDIGLLYYRSDLFQHPPITWQELAQMAQWAQQNGYVRPGFGYVWQGDQYEGLVCNFLEVLGKPLRLNNFTSNDVLDALETMGQWKGTISPQDILTYREDKTFQVWKQGSAAFMRNWTYAIALSNDANRSQVAGKFKIAPLPSGHSCIGGWLLGINAHTTREQQAAAWTFISYMLSVDAQQHAAIRESFMPTLRAMYKKPELSYISGAQNPFVSELPSWLDKGLLRPTSPCYQQTLSPEFQQSLHQALAQARPGQSREQYRPLMQALQNKLQNFTCPSH